MAYSENLEITIPEDVGIDASELTSKLNFEKMRLLL